jgi:predicted DNA-binding transcriptional regulator AlpA
MPARVTSSDEAKPDHLVTPAEARYWLAIGQTTYFKWLKDGRLKPVYFSRRLVRHRSSDIIALIANHEKAGGAA